jgi:hypothetical protein
MSEHTTTVTITNPSGDAALRVSTQGQLRQHAKKYYEFRDDPGVALIRPNSRGSIGGGQFDSNSEGQGKSGDRRFVLAVDRPCVIEVDGCDGKLIAEELELVTYNTGPTWDVKEALTPVRAGVKYTLSPETRISFRPDPRASTDGAFVNFRTGDATVQVSQQTEHEFWSAASAAAWTAPAEAGYVGLVASKDFAINNTSRLVIATESEKDIPLDILNKNALHTMRLFTVGADGVETAVANVLPPQVQGERSGDIWARGLAYQSGRVAIRRGISAIVMQQPQ